MPSYPLKFKFLTRKLSQGRGKHEGSVEKHNLFSWPRGQKWWCGAGGGGGWRLEVVGTLPDPLVVTYLTKDPGLPLAIWRWLSMTKQQSLPISIWQGVKSRLFDSRRRNMKHVCTKKEIWSTFDNFLYNAIKIFKTFNIFSRGFMNKYSPEMPLVHFFLMISYFLIIPI